MRIVCFALLAVAGVLSACHSSSDSHLRSFIPGVYVRAVDHDYATGYDTVVIEQVDERVYRIVRRSTLRLIRNGVQQAPVRNKEVLTGVFDERDQVIYEQRKGKVFSFSPQQGKLFLGSSEYRKVKSKTVQYEKELEGISNRSNGTPAADGKGRSTGIGDH